MEDVNLRGHSGQLVHGAYYYSGVIKGFDKPLVHSASAQVQKRPRPSDESPIRKDRNKQANFNDYKTPPCVVSAGGDGVIDQEES